jgi:hypothetical protein
MVDDHSAANARLKSLAETKKIPLPEGLDEEHERQRAELQDLERRSLISPISAGRSPITRRRCSCLNGR